ncbi:MAG TPA: DUF2267 domain-containing protein [Pseudonocardiaceae bacterium]
MQQHELVSAVDHSAEIGDQGSAERAVRATLSTLGRRLSGGQTANLASQLPAAFADTMPAEGPGERFDLAEFYRRVAEAEGDRCPPQQARRHARAVLAALKVGLTGHEYDHVAAQLPDEYADLLGTEPVQHH